ncbi:ATP-binding protein [Niveispirillum sp. KHB5.9]|uniref:ATP-binding protein n=1 Tax=Niveispirillum sp. KHB5.9 TaxID=3400269 RepID=UPI003A8A5362
MKGGGKMEFQVAGETLDRAEQARMAAELGLPVADGGPHAEAAIVRLVAEGAAVDLMAALRSGCAAVIEQGPAGTLPTEKLKTALADGHLLVSLTTRLAWTLDTAAQFCEGLLARGLLPVTVRHDAELSLHEAIINAVLHGNLAMGGSLVDDPSQFDAFCQRLTATLADPDRANRRIDLSAWLENGHLHIRIADQGGGYDPDSIRPPVNVEAKSGRGLEIMRVMSAGLTVSDGGRTATLAFAV